MPTRSDITVVNSAYDTSGNGSRKLIKLSNGNQYSALKNGTTEYRIYRTTDNWSTSSLFASYTLTTTDIAMVSLPNNRLAYIYTSGTTTILARVFNDDGTVLSNVTLDSSQTVLGNCSLIYSPTDNTLHAAWASKNATYPNSFNIRYAKGTINADGSVTWGTVEQLTTENATGVDYKNPSISIYTNSIPFVVMDYNNGTTANIIRILKRDNTLTVGGGGFHASWSYRNPYTGNGYTQSSPSAIFVPQSINGLTNGRIWVAWHGMDATDTAKTNVRVSYSDDGGVTWSAMAKLTTGNTINRGFTTITANKNNEVFVLYGQDYTVSMVKWTGSWGVETNVATATGRDTGNYPSALFDLTMNVSSPLFITNKFTKVGFYGTWTVTTISVPEGYIGVKTVKDINSLLNYSITSDGTITTVTEKVNNTIVGQGMVSSGVPTDVMISQANWDNVYYGKYHNTDLLKNTTWENKKYGVISVGNPLSSSLDDPTTARTQVACSPSTKYQLVVNPLYEYALVQLNASQNVISIDKMYGYNKNYEFTTSSTTAYLYVEVREVWHDMYGNIVLTGGKFDQIAISQFSLNTLTVEMGSDKWTYTFAKALSDDVTMDDVTKAEKDTAFTVIPKWKTDLSTAINSKGGTSTGADSIDALVTAINGLGGLRSFVGTATSGGNTNFTYLNGGAATLIPLTATGLPFKPIFIYAFRFYSGSLTDASTYTELTGDFYPKPVKVISGMGTGNSQPNVYHIKGDVAPSTVSVGTFTIPVASSSSTYTYIAFG